MAGPRILCTCGESKIPSIDLALTVPVHYAVVDGVIGMEGDGPIMGTAKPVGAVIMGKHLLAVDSTAARIMGFNPRKISYLEMAVISFPRTE